MRSQPVLVSLLIVAAGIIGLDLALESHSSEPRDTANAEPTPARREQPGCFVPNVGQWADSVRFLHRSGPMTVFVEDRGWILGLVDHDASVRMTFVGARPGPDIVGEEELAGRHDYFVGNDDTRWRTGVPRFASVRYASLYPGVDLRLHDRRGVVEYDLMLEPGADLSKVVVHVEGADALRIAADGSLVIETGFGPLTQPVPETWEVAKDGVRREVVCKFRLCGSDRFGFDAPSWQGNTGLVVDPKLIWSTYLPGGDWPEGASAVSVDGRGFVTVVGWSGPGGMVSGLDPGEKGSAQLVYSTFLGTGGPALAVSVADDGVVTVVGSTTDPRFPTTAGAYDTTHNGGFDAFLTRLDPSKSGSARLVYSTYVGGTGDEWAPTISVDARGVITVAGSTKSSDFPTTRGAWDTSHNGKDDVFVCRLDPSKTGAAQLVYSSVLGGSGLDAAHALAVEANGVVTVAGDVRSADFPTTSGAFDTTHNGANSAGGDVFVSRLDPNRSGSAQLVYSTFLGGKFQDVARGLAVDAGGVVTVAGYARSEDFPTTAGAYDTTQNGSEDAFISRLDPSKKAAAQLVYSTFLGGSLGVWGSMDHAYALSVDRSGVVTVTGLTASRDFPTTAGAFDTTYNGDDAFVSRIDPRRTGLAQLVYSTYLGGRGPEQAHGLWVDASGVATVVGQTHSTDFPTTAGAADTTYNGSQDAFVSRLDMGVALYADVHEVSNRTGGTQTLTVNAGKAYANRSYWIFGSVTGTRPGLDLLGVHIPLNPDVYTDVAMASVNTTVFTKFRGVLDADGQAMASFRVPANLPVPAGFTFHHAYVVYDAQGKIYMASNPVPLHIEN